MAAVAGPTEPVAPDLAALAPPIPWWVRQSRWLLGALGVLVVLAGWQVGADAHWFNVEYTSSPTRIVAAGVSLFASGQIWPDLAATGVEVGWGMLITLVLGIPLGVLLGWFRTLDAMTEPIISVLYSVPYVIFLPVIIFWFGIGNTSRVIMVVWSAVFSLLVNVQAGVQNISPEYLRVARAFSTPRFKVLLSVALPASLPYVLAGLRLAIGRALLGAIVAELFMSSQGLGHFVQEASSSLDMSSAFVGVALIAVAAIVLTRLVGVIERRFTHWSGPV